VRLHVVNPTITTGREGDSRLAYARAAGAHTEITISTLRYGPSSVESRHDVVLATPAVIQAALAAEAELADAIVVDCMLDPGVRAAREVCGVPTIGPGEAAMRLAAILGQSFSIICPGQVQEFMMRDQARRFGVAHRLASVRSLGIPVLELDDDPTRTLAATVTVAARCVREDHAHVIVLGCTSLAGKAPLIDQALADQGAPAIVIDPPSAATRALETMVAMGLTQSLRTYPRRPEKPRIWPDDPSVTTPL
jgi:allantoin racemase